MKWPGTGCEHTGINFIKRRLYTPISEVVRIHNEEVLCNELWHTSIPMQLTGIHCTHNRNYANLIVRLND